MDQYSVGPTSGGNDAVSAATCERRGACRGQPPDSAPLCVWRRGAADHDADGSAGQQQRGPRKEREPPWCGLDVERERRRPGGDERRRAHPRRECDERHRHSREDGEPGAVARGAPPEPRGERDRRPHHVEDVDLEDAVERGARADQPRLDAEEERQPEDLPAAPLQRPRRLGDVAVAPLPGARGERDRHAREEQEERRAIPFRRNTHS